MLKGQACQYSSVLMVSLRIGERAIPVAWRVFATSGAIGFEDQKPLLDRSKRYDT